MPSSQTRVVVVKKAGRGEVCENHTDQTNDDATSDPEGRGDDRGGSAGARPAPAR